MSGYVLAIDGAGRSSQLAERAGTVKPWGQRFLKRQVGVLGMTGLDGELGPDPGRLVARAKTSGLAGILILRAPRDESALAALATACDAAGLFILAPGSVL